jgi:8-oxo-dGTP diphosphatase
MKLYYDKWKKYLTEQIESAYLELPPDIKSEVDAQKDEYRASYALSDNPSEHGAGAQVWIKDIKDRTGWDDETATEYYKANVQSNLEPAMADEPHYKHPKAGLDAMYSGPSRPEDDPSGKVYMGKRHQPDAGYGERYKSVYGHEQGHAFDYELGGDFERPMGDRPTNMGPDGVIRPTSRTNSNAWNQRDKFELAFPGIVNQNLGGNRVGSPHWRRINEPYADIIQLRAQYNKEWQEGRRATPHLTVDDLRNLEKNRVNAARRGSDAGQDLGQLIYNMRNPDLEDQEVVDILNSIAVMDSPAGPVVAEKLIFDKWRNYINEDKQMDTDKIAKAVVYDGNKVLILKRSESLDKHPGEWDLPGGHIIEGEDMQDGLLREVWEEAGLRISRPEKLYSQGRNTYYKVQLPQKKVSLSNEHMDHKMVDVRDLKNYDLPSKYVDAITRAFK